MARILICEAHDDISALLDLVVRRLGHEPVTYAVGDLPSHVDAAVIEPGDPDALRLARELRDRDVPVLFTSIYPADDDLLELRAGDVPRQALPALRARARTRCALADRRRLRSPAVPSAL